MQARMARFRAGIGALVIAGAIAAAGPPAATAGTVTCPSGVTYTMTQGDPPLPIQGTCTGTGTVTYSVLVWPSHGSLVGTPAGDATYTPSIGFVGTDSFTYRATDSEGGFTDRSVSIVVQAGSSGLPPSCANPMRVSIPFGQTVTLTGNCTDPEGLAVTYALVSGPAFGGLQILGPNSVGYSPPTGVTSDSFTYSATDPQGNTTIADVLIDVLQPGDPNEIVTAADATPSSPLVAGVETEGPAAITIGPRPVSSPPPSGWFFLGTEFKIEAPIQEADHPLRLTFTVDRTALPLSGGVTVFRDAAPISSSCDTAGIASPDPCIESSGPTDPGDPASDLRIVLLSTHASRWNLGYASRPANKNACKGNGWTSFPGFKSEGDCVSWVATRGRNAPAG